MFKGRYLQHRRKQQQQQQQQHEQQQQKNIKKVQVKTIAGFRFFRFASQQGNKRKKRRARARKCLLLVACRRPNPRASASGHFIFTRRRHCAVCCTMRTPGVGSMERRRVPRKEAEEGRSQGNRRQPSLSGDGMDREIHCRRCLAAPGVALAWSL